ncbi:hypothetical protein IEQ34_023088 [Dendrobium chrysotoxum]|uniref:Ubiquitin-like protease family profile domain-containing protein n=1 Tax=Dendrobium chrysotoxum TaxID=161865 RepID=A0AAV7G0V5_DENCH|nr:hypothetical protein IEQ34_023088 [Dendrobium chrysotoxum]
MKLKTFRKHICVRFLNIFEHVPPQGSTLYKYDSKQYVSHVSKESVRAANLLLMPVSNNEHWTLLVADLKSLSWTFFDSLPNPTHKAVLPNVINHLHEETRDYFESDFRSWPLTVGSGVPTQKNRFDCGMFVCKYMKNAILAHPFKWEELSHWQDEMPKFRAKLAFALLCKTIN